MFMRTITVGMLVLVAGLAAMAGTAQARWVPSQADEQRARWIALAYWDQTREPCRGRVQVGWAPFKRKINARSFWPPNQRFCHVWFNERLRWDWAKYCTIMVHEYGHLVTGRERHSYDPYNVMYRAYVQPLAECLVEPAPAAPAEAP